MSTEQQIWQSLSSSPMNQLADLLTAYDNAIAQHGLKPGSELALRIYSELIRRWKEGSLKDLVKVTQLNAFSFGKQNGYSSPKDLKAKKLTFDDSQENTRRIQSKTAISLADRTTRTASLEDLEKRLTRQVHTKRKYELLKALELHKSYNKLRKIVLKRHLNMMHQRLNSEQPAIIKNRLRRFKLENAIYFDQARLRGLFFRNWRKITKINKQNRQNSLKQYKKFRNEHMMSCYFQNWLDYATRKQQQKQQQLKIKNNKQKLRKILFIQAFKKFKRRPINNAQDELKTNRLAMKLFYQRLKQQKNTNKIEKGHQKAIKSTILLNKAPQLIRALSNNMHLYDLHSSKLIEMRRFLYGRRLLSTLYFTTNTNKQYWKTKGPKQVPLVCLLLSALQYHHRRLGYNEKWMDDMPLIDGFQQQRIKKLAFNGLRKVREQQRQAVQIIKLNTKQKISTFINNSRELLKVRQNNNKSEQLLHYILTNRIQHALSKFNSFHQHTNKIKQIRKYQKDNKICQFFNKISTRSLGHRFTNRQLQNHIQVKNYKKVKECFDACKQYLLQRSLMRKIAIMTDAKNNNKIVKNIFQFLKLRAFQAKRRSIKSANLIKLRRFHYGSTFIRLVKQNYSKLHYFNELKQQALRLHKYNTQNKVFTFMKIKSNLTKMQRVIESRIDLERNNKTLFTCFHKMKEYCKKRTNYRMRDGPNTLVIHNKIKKRIMDKWLNRTIMSIKLERLSRQHQKLIKIFTWKLMAD